MSLPAVLLLLASPAWAANHYPIDSRANLIVDEFGVKKRVTNNCPARIHVPTRTDREWSMFRANKPGCVRLDDVVGCTPSCPNPATVNCGCYVDDGCGHACPGPGTQNCAGCHPRGTLVKTENICTGATLMVRPGICCGCATGNNMTGNPACDAVGRDFCRCNGGLGAGIMGHYCEVARPW
ncbi:MAG TPA: hypothetical protein VM598_10665 [Bdellovibrionota bacterium]|nr:hypothetical protein [Bdellovibrionota bacterium]